jgi:hypothetical protein
MTNKHKLTHSRRITDTTGAAGGLDEPVATRSGGRLVDIVVESELSEAVRRDIDLWTG